MTQNNFGDTVLILDRDREAASAVASRHAREDRLILTGADTAVGSLVLARMPLALLHADAGLDGPFSFAVLDLIADARRRAATCNIVLACDEQLSAPWCAEARRRGATDIVRRETSGATAGTAPKGTILHIPTIDELIASADLLPAFQPIVDLDSENGSGYGFESLARFDDGALTFCDPLFLFEYARLTGKTADLELACLRRTLREARMLPAGSKLFINMHPHVLADPRLAPTLIVEAAENGVSLANVVLEITEQEKLDPTPAVTAAFAELRGYGVQFALDDVGIAYSHLDRLECVKPSFLKISHEFGTDFEKNPTRRKIIGNILSLARDFECEVVLEGIETAATSGAAHEIGARFAQGFFYAKPQRVGEPRIESPA